MNRLTKLFAVTAIGAALLAAGCGGDDDETTSTTASTSTTTTEAGGETITKEQFITQADQICKSGDEAIDAASQGLDRSSSAEEIEQFITATVLPSIQAQYDGIAALPVPAGDEATIEELLGSLQSAIDEAEADPAALAASESSADDPFAEVNQAARDYGLKDCGDG